MTGRQFTVEEAHARKRHFAHALGGRLTQIPERVHRRMGAWPSRHYFVLRLPEGLLVWFECWCNDEGVIEEMRRQAQDLTRQGFRCAFLDTRLSTRWIGMRRPMLVAAPNSYVSFDRISERLATLLQPADQKKD